jgi:flagellar FliL protein
MADDDDTEGDEKSGNGKKKIIIFVALALFLVGLSIGGTLFAVKVMSPQPEPQTVLDENGNPVLAEDEEEKNRAKDPAIYSPLKPPIIVNFQARGRQRFMQAEISLMTRDDDVIEAVEIHMPVIRNSLVLLFGGQIYEELQTEAGRELMRQQALQELQTIMEKEIGKPGIEKLLFTNLVMQ